MILKNILKKFKNIESDIDEIRSALKGRETSLSQIKNNSPEELDNFRKVKDSFEQIQARHLQSVKEIEDKIRDAYTSKYFAYTSLYMVLYCIVALVLGGLYESFPSKQNLFGNFLFYFTSSSIIYLLFVLFLDKHNPKQILEKKKSKHSKPVFQFSPRNANGYRMAIFLFTIAVGLSFLLSLFEWFDLIIEYSPKFGTKYSTFHHVCICVSIFYPILSFIFYYIKAKIRASKITNNLEVQSEEILDQCKTQLGEIDRYIGNQSFDTSNITF